VQVLVGVGDVVEEGQEVATLYAMKVESKLRAPRAGVVASVTVALNQQVALNAVVLTLEPLEDDESKKDDKKKK
jgi:3-methylcrotonyl-CoA carboxylase alpha subunit